MSDRIQRYVPMEHEAMTCHAGSVAGQPDDETYVTVEDHLAAVAEGRRMMGRLLAGVYEQRNGIAPGIPAIVLPPLSPHLYEKFKRFADGEDEA